MDAQTIATKPGLASVAAAPTVAIPSHPRVAPLAPGRYLIQATVGQAVHAKLDRYKSLMSHEIPSGDLEQLLDRALDIAIAHVEKRKYATTSRPRSNQPRSKTSRRIPAAVRRAVRKRDQERCTYVSPDGKRCDATAMLEFDHVVAYARGGDSSISNIRLRCRTHNQLEAERTYGETFMESKRQQAIEARRAP